MDYISDVLQFRGSHYEFGFYQGEKLRHSPTLENRQRLFKKREHRHFQTDKSLTMDHLSDLSPRLIDEIQGLSDALKMPMDDAYKYFGGYYLEQVRSGCSIYTSEDFFIRNYDSHPRSYEGRFIFYQPNDGGYAHMGPAMQITGRIDGMNEHGLTIGYNFTHTKKSGDGFLCNMIARIVLESCKNVEEAITLLEDISHRHSFSYVVQDKKGKSYVIEASPRTVIHRQSSVCTNHFHVLEEENRYRQEETKERESNIINYQATSPNAYDAFKIMNQFEKGIASHKYSASAGTIHTSMYMPKELNAVFSLGTDRLPVVFNFKEWLEGKDLAITKIKGSLESTIPFANTEKNRMAN